MSIANLKVFIFTVFVFFGVGCDNAFSQIVCPSAPQQSSKEVMVDTELTASAIAKLGQGKLTNRTKIIANNLFEKYPNADKVAIAHLLVSMYCEIIKNSKTMSDSDKSKMFNDLTIMILQGKLPEKSEASKSNRIVQKKKNSKLSAATTPNSVRPFARLGFDGTKDFDYDVVFNINEPSVSNADFKVVSFVSLGLICNSDERKVVKALSRPGSNSLGYNSNRYYIFVYEERYLLAAQKWLKNANGIEKTGRNKYCKFDLFFDKYYDFTYTDSSAQVHHMYYKYYGNIYENDKPNIEFSTIGADRWHQVNEAHENISSRFVIDFEDLSEININKIIYTINRLYG